MNTAKTKISPPGARKVIMGILVDSSKLRVAKGYKQKIKQTLWAIEKYGWKAQKKELKFKSILKFQAHLLGKIKYIKQIEPDLGDSLLNQFASL